MARSKTRWAEARHPWLRTAGETRLAEWMNEQHYSVQGLAEEIGVTRKRLEYWRNGQMLPTLVWAFKLEKLSQGAVPASSWLATDLGRRTWGTEGSEVTK